MKKSHLLLTLIIPLLFSSCSRNNSSSVENVSTSEKISNVENSISSSSLTTSNDIFISSSISSSSEESSSTSSSEETPALTLLSEIITEANKLKTSVNELGVAESNIKANINLKLLSVTDVITSKALTGNRYKLLMTNGEQYIYVKVNDRVYSSMKTRVGLSFNVQGTLSYYCGHPEITCSLDRLEEVNLDVDESNLFVSKTLDEVYNLIDNMEVNNKGCNGGELVKVKLKLLAKLNTNVGVFHNGDKIISIHGNDKFMNSMNVNNVYEIKGAITMHNFKPGIEFIDYSSVNENIYNIDYLALDKMDADIYKITYEVDKNKTYPNYTNTFKHLYVVEGYINYYQKDSSYYAVIDYEYKENIYSTYQNALNAKALFISNEASVKLKSEQDLIHDPLYPYYNEKKKVSIVVIPYLLNTNHYWQVAYVNVAPLDA